MRRMVIGIVVVAMIAAGALGYYMYQNRALESPVAESGLHTSEAQTIGNTEETTELMALVDSQEEAEEIASLYDITLSSYAYGVAIYTTDRDAGEVISEGQEQGYPELSINQDDYELYENE